MPPYPSSAMTKADRKESIRERWFMFLHASWRVGGGPALLACVQRRKHNQEPASRLSAAAPRAPRIERDGDDDDVADDHLLDEVRPAERRATVAKEGHQQRARQRSEHRPLPPRERSA